MIPDKILEEDIANIAESIDELSRKINGRTFLITGGSGFIGKYLVQTLHFLNTNKLKRKCRIISVDNYITSSSEHSWLTKSREVEFIKLDVSKPFKISASVDYIVHAAGIASPVDYGKYPLETIDTAVYGTRNALDLAKAKRVKSFLFFSSSEIYGNPSRDSIPTKETYNGNVSSTGSRACYDESKRLGETLCMTYYDLFKTPVKIVRPFNIFGPRMSHQDQRVIPSIIYRAINNKDILIHSNGKQTRTFCYISDAVSAFFKVLLSTKSGQVYNVGNSNNEISMNDLANLIGKVVDKKVKIKNVNYPKNYPGDEPLRRCPDITKIKKKLNYSPKIDLEEGLTRTATWCKKFWKPAIR
ncbi:MAG: NAD-dependent epimerase/dehydratase family protein [Patescibacteria group bacterium]